jgi:hypothetical protein
MRSREALEDKAATESQLAPEQDAHTDSILPPRVVVEVCLWRPVCCLFNKSDKNNKSCWCSSLMEEFKLEKILSDCSMSKHVQPAILLAHLLPLRIELVLSQAQSSGWNSEDCCTQLHWKQSVRSARESAFFWLVCFSCLVSPSRCQTEMLANRTGCD